MVQFDGCHISVKERTSTPYSVNVFTGMWSTSQYMVASVGHYVAKRIPKQIPWRWQNMFCFCCGRYKIWLAGAIRLNAFVHVAQLFDTIDDWMGRVVYMYFDTCAIHIIFRNVAIMFVLIISFVISIDTFTWARSDTVAREQIYK